MKTISYSLLLLVGLSADLLAQTQKKASDELPGKIAWYATWKSGLAEAERSGRPILLLSAAPHCHNISGIW